MSFRRAVLGGRAGGHCYFKLRYIWGRAAVPNLIKIARCICLLGFHADMTLTDKWNTHLNHESNRKEVVADDILAFYVLQCF